MAHVMTQFIDVWRVGTLARNDPHCSRQRRVDDGRNLIGRINDNIRRCLQHVSDGVDRSLRHLVDQFEAFQNMADGAQGLRFVEPFRFGIDRAIE